MKQWTSIFLCILLIFALVTPVLAEPENIDYHDLFIRYQTLDGMLAEKYHIEVGETFDADPERFIAELSKEDTDTILHHGFYLSVEQEYKNRDYTVLEDYLAEQLAQTEPGSALANTISILRCSNLICGSCTLLNNFPSKSHTNVQSAYWNNPYLFLLTLDHQKSSYFVITKMTQALLYDLDDNGLDKLDAQLLNDESADWATEETRAMSRVIREAIELKQYVAGHTDIDVSILLSRMHLEFGYADDEYYWMLSEAFALAPEHFITEFSKMPIHKAISFFPYLNQAYEDNFSDYASLLNQMSTSASPAELDVLYVFKMGILLSEIYGAINAPSSLGRTCYEQMQAFYQENHYLFLECIGIIGDEATIGAALTHGLDANQLDALDAQLASNAEADWPDDGIRRSIDLLRLEVTKAILREDPANVDFHTLIKDRENADAYYYPTLYELFAAGPDQFATALGQEDYRAIAEIGYGLANNRKAFGREDFSAYKTELKNALQRAELKESAEALTILHNAALLISNHFPPAIKSAFSNDPRLFFQTLSVRYNDTDYINETIELFLRDSTDEELQALRTTLKQYRISDWSTVTIQDVIGKMLTQVEQRIGPDIPVVEATEPSHPTATSPEPTQQKADHNNKMIVIIMILVVILGTVVILFVYAKKKMD